MTRATLLGPLSDSPALAAELAALGVDGPVALITAGWEEAERNDAQLDRWLGGGTRNLGLYGRRLDILESDPHYATAEHHLRARLAEMRDMYLLRLRHALGGLDAVRRRMAGAPRRHAGELEEAIDAVRAVDSDHDAAQRSAYTEFYTTYPPHDRAIIRTHRDAVAAIVGECAAVAIAGGHVATLNNCLHLCNIGAVLDGRPLLAWSSGCMAIAEQVVVVDDHDPGLRPDEVFDAGIGAVRGVVPLPAAGARLHDGDRDRLALLARRCAPRVCVLLDEDDRVGWDDANLADLRKARVITLDGRIHREGNGA